MHIRAHSLRSSDCGKLRVHFNRSLSLSQSQAPSQFRGQTKACFCFQPLRHRWMVCWRCSSWGCLCVCVFLFCQPQMKRNCRQGSCKPCLMCTLAHTHTRTLEDNKMQTVGYNGIQATVWWPQKYRLMSTAWLFCRSCQRILILAGCPFIWKSHLRPLGHNSCFFMGLCCGGFVRPQSFIGTLPCCFSLPLSFSLSFPFPSAH